MELQKKQPVKQRERSTPYPGLTLEEAVLAIRQLKDGLGKGPYSREAIAKALGHSTLTGPAARKVAALGHYGLLQKDGNAYSLSELTVDILNPISEKQKEDALVKAAYTPRLFEKLFLQYKGQSLPSMLDSILIREGISESAAKEVTNIFTTTFEFVGLLKHGILLEKTKENSVENTPPKTTEIDSRGKKPTYSSETIMTFNFSGGLSLILPKTKKTETAVMDGELKDARILLQKFAEKYCTNEEHSEEKTAE